MIPNLAEFLQVLIPHLDPEITTPLALSRLQKLAPLLAPIYRGGFECRLGEKLTQVDLQQCICAKDNEPKILAEHIARGTAFVDWKQIGQFLEVWSDPNSSLHEGITEIWLEFDLDDSAPQILIPSVFITLNKNLANSNNKALAIAEAALELLWGQPIGKPLQSNLHRCFAVGMTPARISHIGLMLSRPIKTLRVNVSDLPSDQIAYYLQQVGWNKSTMELQTLTVQLLELVDQVRICLDVGSTVADKVGLECFFKQQPELESRWSAFLDYLVAEGLSTSEKREALLAWAGNTTPTSSSNPWPYDLIAASLLQPPNRLSIFKRQLSHIKLTYQPQHPLEAKGYLEFSHQWLETKSSADEEQVKV